MSRQQRAVPGGDPGLDEPPPPPRRERPPIAQQPPQPPQQPGPADEPPAAPAPQQPTPPAPSTPARPEPAPAPAGAAEVARRGETVPGGQSGLLASVLANSDTRTQQSGQPNGNGPTYDGPSIPLGMLRPAQVEPDEDLTMCGYRFPRYVVEAINLWHLLTRRPRQKIAADIVLGRLSDDDWRVWQQLLDQAFRNIYGYDRPRNRG